MNRTAWKAGKPGIWRSVAAGNCFHFAEKMAAFRFRSIEFDDQLALMATEVGEERTHWDLALEAKIGELAVAQGAPEFSFGLR